MKALLDAVLVDIGGTLVQENPGGGPTSNLEVMLRADALEDLTWLTETVRLGAVTNTAVMDEAQLRSVLEPSGVADLLEVIVTSVDVGVAKPDPKVLLVAMDRLGLEDPQRVLFVGDAAEDEEAAAAAGMMFLALPAVSGSTEFTIRQAMQAWLERLAGHRFEAARARVTKSDIEAANTAAALHARLSKPSGSLGRLESLGIQLAGIAGECPPPVPEPATVAIFAADHGVVDLGVSPWPQTVTAQMLSNFAAGGAAINVLARHVNAQVLVVDVGVANTLSATADPAVLARAVRKGTANLAAGAAMSRTDALLALDVGVEIAERAVHGGARCLIAGDMGIGNTTSATAIIAGITNQTPQEIAGRGSGADDEMLAHKIAVIEAATAELSSTSGPLTLLEQVGGFEIAAIVGFIVGGAAARVPVIVDGVIADAALLVAVQLAPDVIDFVIAGHRSTDPGAQAALEFVGLQPILDLDLCLGEGTGAALALPVVQAAAKILREMATFDPAAISEST